VSWVKLDDNALDDPRLLALERGTVLLHLEALAFSNRYGLDGSIPRAALQKMTTEPDPARAAAALVEAGLWEASDDGWQLIWLLGDQFTAEKAKELREEARARMERVRAHNKDDHRLCDPKRCWVLRSGERSRERSGSPSSPVPSSPKRKEDEGERSTAGGASAAAGGTEPAVAAPPARWGPPLNDLDGAFLDQWMTAGYDWCTRCQGAFPSTIIQEDPRDDAYLCPSCTATKGRRPKGCLAFTKAGKKCGNDHQADSLWCKYHPTEDRRGQAGPDEREVIDRPADKAIAQLAATGAPREVLCGTCHKPFERGTQYVRWGPEPRRLAHAACYGGGHGGVPAEEVHVWPDGWAAA